MYLKYSLAFCFWILISFFDSSSQKDVEGEWSMAVLTAEEDPTSERPFTRAEILEERRSTKAMALGLSVSAEAAAKLCQQIDDKIANEDMKPPALIHVNVKTQIKNLQTVSKLFNSLECIKWTLFPCEGIPYGQFDPECYFWMPLKDNNSPECTGSRRRRRASQDDLKLNGLDAAALCASLYSDSNVIFNSVMMKADEESQFRCIEWEFRTNIWIQKPLSNIQCKNNNSYRQRFVGVDEYSPVSCWNQGGIVKCSFHKY